MPTTNPMQQAIQATQQIRQRNVEMIALAARQVLGAQHESWRDGVNPSLDDVRQRAFDAMKDLGYNMLGENFPETISSETQSKIQDVYTIKQWLTANKKHSPSAPIVRRYKEFEALLDLNCYHLASRLDIDHTNPIAQQQRLLKSGDDINMPTQAARRQ